MFRALGIIAGVFSLSLLVWKGFHIELGPFMVLVLDVYAREASAFFGLAEPSIKAALLFLEKWVRIDIDLYPHWKHAFVLMFLIFGAIARTAWWSGDKPRAIFLFCWGTIVALLAGTAAGTVELDGAVSNMLMAFWPIMGVVVFYLGLDAWIALFEGFDDFTSLAWWIITRIALPGLVLLVAGTQIERIPGLHDVETPGLVLLTSLVLIQALFFLWQGVAYPEGGGDTRWQQTINDGDTHTALDMLSIIGGAAFVVLVGAAGI